MRTQPNINKRICKQLQPLPDHKCIGKEWSSRRGHYSVSLQVNDKNMSQSPKHYHRELLHLRYAAQPQDAKETSTIPL